MCCMMLTLWPLGIHSKITCLCLLWNEFHVIDHVFYQVEKLLLLYLSKPFCFYLNICNSYAVITTKTSTYKITLKIIIDFRLT